MKLWLSRLRYLAATQPFHYCNYNNKWNIFHRVNCAVFILIWSFKDFSMLHAVRYESWRNNCEYALSEHRESQKCNNRNGSMKFIGNPRSGKFHEFPPEPFLIPRNLSLPLFVFLRWWFPNIWSMLYTARGFDRGLFWEVIRPRSAFMALIIIIEIDFNFYQLLSQFLLPINSLFPSRYFNPNNFAGQFFTRLKNTLIFTKTPCHDNTSDEFEQHSTTERHNL